MKTEQLRAEVHLELSRMEQLVEELEGLAADVAGRWATVRERTAAGAFLAQFYMGLENILKRLCRFHGVALPVSERWHVELFERFCGPSYGPLPALFDEALAADLDPYRTFRHVVHHGYGFDLAWGRMEAGIAGVGRVYARLREAVLGYLEGLAG